MKRFAFGVVVCLVITAPKVAIAFELDALLPDDVPGYGSPFAVIDDNRLRRVDNGAGMIIGGLNLEPALHLGAGYDSAPNGASRGSAVLQQTPSLVIADTEIGLGAYAAGTFQQFPQNAVENTAGGALALGERAVLPRETITCSAAYLDTAETGFALTTLALNRPVAFTLGDLRASDRISLGQFTVTPKISVSDYRFSQFTGQDRADIAESVLSEYAPGGTGKLVVLLHATQSRYRDAGFNADTAAALAGVEDDAAGLWTIRILAGAARRRARATGDLTAPVLEVAADWMPGDLDQARLTLAREIDDPDQVSAAPYTLTQAKMSLAHEYLRNIIFNVSAAAANASYLQTRLRESLFNTDAAVNWRLSAALAVDAEYAFNDRQANFLRAANEHVVTVGVTWTP